MPPVQALTEDQVHYLNVLRLSLPPSTFGLFANGAAKLLLILVVFLQRFFRLEKRVTLSSRLPRNYLLKKSVKTLRLRQMIQPFPSTMELFTNAGRNRVDFEI